MSAEEREQRLVFGEDAEQYDRARPSYPRELIGDLVAWVGRDARAVDVGCGTAKAAALLAGAGMSGVGVEPHPSMAAVAERNLSGHPRWRVDVADFETWHHRPDDLPVDLVTCAQAWHWVDPAVGWQRAADVLRPGGWLALWWNWAACEPPDMGPVLDEIYARHGPALDFRRLRPTQPPVPQPPDDVVDLAEPVLRAYPWDQEYSTTEFLDFLGTHSSHRLLASDQLDALLDDIGEAVDARGGVFQQGYVCRLYAFQRL